jgi:hypothetical protein
MHRMQRMAKFMHSSRHAAEKPIAAVAASAKMMTVCGEKMTSRMSGDGFGQLPID